jgi:hypothetical protein
MPASWSPERSGVALAISSFRLYRLRRRHGRLRRSWRTGFALRRPKRNRVLLLEAGGKDDWIWFHIPVGYLFAIGNPRADWMFRTEAEPGLNGRSLIYPRGKVIGGSSLPSTP